MIPVSYVLFMCRMISLKACYVQGILGIAKSPLFYDAQIGFGCWFFCRWVAYDSFPSSLNHELMKK